MQRALAWAGGTAKHLALVFIVGVTAALVNELPPAQWANDLANTHAAALGWAGGLLLAGGGLAVLAALLSSSDRKRGRGRERHRAGIGRLALAELKQALRDGRVWREPLWRRRALLFLGCISLMFGLLVSILALADHPAARLLVAAATLYAAARFTWALIRL